MKDKKQLEKVKEKLYTEGYKDFHPLIKEFDNLMVNKILEGKETLSDIRSFRDKLIKELM